MTDKVPIKKIAKLKWHLISRALSNHDAPTVYTLLSETLPDGMAGQALLELIRSVPDWPTPYRVVFEKRLTRRELEILQAAADGLSILGTAKRLIIAPTTVSSYRKTLLIKFDVHTMSDAITAGREYGLIS